jgi:hypothetical protein
LQKFKDVESAKIRIPQVSAFDDKEDGNNTDRLPRSSGSEELPQDGSLNDMQSSISSLDYDCFLNTPFLTRLKISEEV